MQEQTNSYTLHDSALVDINVSESAVTFMVDGNIVGRSTLGDADYRFAVWLFYSSVEIKVEYLVVDIDAMPRQLNIQTLQANCSDHIISFNGNLGMAWVELGIVSKIELKVRVISLSNNLDFGLQMQSVEATSDITHMSNMSGISSKSTVT